MTEPLRLEELTAMKNRCQKASQGPHVVRMEHSPSPWNVDRWEYHIPFVAHHMNKGDADLMAHARRDIERLLEDVWRTRQEALVNLVFPPDKEGSYQSDERSLYERTMEQKERILEAFVAETGCLPSECMMVERHTDKGIQFWVERRKS